MSSFKAQSHTRETYMNIIEQDKLIDEVLSGLKLIDETARHRITGTDDPSIAIGAVISMLENIQQEGNRYPKDPYEKSHRRDAPLAPMSPFETMTEMQGDNMTEMHVEPGRHSSINFEEFN